MNRSHPVFTVMLWLLGVLCVFGAVEGAAAGPIAGRVNEPAQHASSTSAEAALQRAYQREVALLLGEQRALLAQQDHLKRTRAERLEALSHETATLEAGLIATELEREALEHQLTALSEAAAAAVDADAVDAISQQAAARFGHAVCTTPAQDVDAGRNHESASKDRERVCLDEVFTAALAALHSEQRVTIAVETSFDQGGTAHTGRVWRLGAVARAAVDGVDPGPLLPAGDGRWKRPRTDPFADEDIAVAADTFRDLTTSATGLLPVWLADPQGRAVDERPSLGFIAYTNGGGAIAWVIVALGAIALLMAVARGLWLRALARGTGRLLEELPVLLAARRLDDARALAARFSGPGARMAQTLLKEVTLVRSVAEEQASAIFLRESARIDRLGAVVLLAAAVAPLLGLLGTVTGMIATFDIITEHGNANPRLLSSGISEALITTMYGLIVAIPALVLGNLQNGAAEQQKNDVERLALTVLNARDDVATIGGDGSTDRSA